MSLAGMVILSQAAPAPKADPKAFFLPVGAVALPAITGSALVDGLLLGKVAFLKAAILGGLLLSQTGGDGAPAVAYEEPAPAYYEEPAPAYGPPQVTYEEPAPAYAAPAPSYDAPSYSAPAPSYETPDTYGAPVADPVNSYGAPSAPVYSRY